MCIFSLEKMNKITLDGFKLSNLNKLEALEMLLGFCLKSTKQQTVITPNLHFLSEADKKPMLKKLINEASIQLPDGKPLIWASKLLKHPLKERITGSDIFTEFLPIAHANSLRLFIVGGQNGSIKRAIKKMKQEYPHITCEGFEPPFTDIDNYPNDEIIEKINAFKPHMVFVAIGFPKQDFWIKNYGNKTNAKVLMSVGASLEFYLNDIKRAPIWMQKTGLEWLFRLLLEPKRLFKRYLQSGIYFLKLVFKIVRANTCCAEK